MALDSRADLDTLADATFTTNGVGGISGAELNDGYKRLAEAALIKNEAGDIGAGLAWAADVLKIATAGVTLAMMENRAAATFIGRKSGAGTGAPQEMTGTEAKAILAIAAADVSGLSAFATSTDLASATGTLAIARIADGTVTLAKLANLAQATVIGRASGAGTGVPTALVASDLSTILGLSAFATSTDLANATGTLAIARIADGTVTLAKQANLAQATVIGRASGAGTGVPTALVAADLSTILGLSAFATSTDLANATGTLPIARIADGSVTLIKLNNTPEAVLVGRAVGAGTGQFQALFGIQAAAIIGIQPVGLSGDAADLTGTLAIARIADGTVTLAKMANLAAATIIGRASGAGTGVPTALSAAQVSTILGLSAFATSTDLANATGTLAIARIADATVTLAKMANLAQSTIIGRASGAGTGVPTALSVAQVLAILGLSSSDSPNFAGMTLDGNLVMSVTPGVLTTTANAMSFRASTADGADTAVASIGGGGSLSSTRGAMARAFGNEHASSPGNLELTAGDTGSIVLLGSNIDGLFFGKKTYDPPNVLNSQTWQTTVTVTGARVGDLCIATHSQITTQNWTLSACVSANDVVTVTGVNLTGGAIDLASGTLRVMVLGAPN